jgi:hypothetical protein
MKITFVCGNNGCFDKTRFEKNTLLRKHFTRRRASSSKRCTINKGWIRIVMRAARPPLMEFHGRAKRRWNWESKKFRSAGLEHGTPRRRARPLPIKLRACAFLSSANVRFRILNGRLEPHSGRRFESLGTWAKCLQVCGRDKCKGLDLLITKQILKSKIETAAWRLRVQ